MELVDKTSLVLKSLLMGLLYHWQKLKLGLKLVSLDGLSVWERCKKLFAC